MSTPAKNIPLADIWVDEMVPVRAGWTPEEAAEWAGWARAMLRKTSNRNRAIVSDRAGNRGPNGERYALIGFDGLRYVPEPADDVCTDPRCPEQEYWHDPHDADAEVPA